MLHKQLKYLHFAYTAVTQHIIQQLEAEGHHLGIVVTMKGYLAVIVDIIGFLGLKGKTPKWYSYSYSEFSSKKEKNIYRDYAVGHHVTSLTGVHNR